MKIVQVITKGEVGGAQHHVAALAMGLRDRGHEVVIVVGRRGAVTDALTAEGFEVRHVEVLGDSTATGLWTGRTALVREFRSLRPNVIHTHSSHAGLLGRAAAYALNVPCVYTAHGWPFKRGAGWRQRVVSLAGEVFARRYRASVICVSPVEAELAIRYRVAPSDRLSVVANGVPDVAQELRRNDVVSAVSTNGSDSRRDGRTRLLFASRLAAPKRPDLLVDALDMLGRSDVACVLGGDGPMRSEVERRVRQRGLGARIEVPGDLHDVAQRLANTDIYVLVSDHEGSPLGVIEAMRSGVPVIASDLPGTRQLLRDGAAGVLCENNPAAIASAINELLEDPDRRFRLGRAGRELYESQHTVDRMADQVERIYHSVAVSR